MMIMWFPFKPLCCQCAFCGQKWHIPARRIRLLERLLTIKKEEPFILQCHYCHEGVVTTEPYKNIYGELLRIDPKELKQGTKVAISGHYSIIPLPLVMDMLNENPTTAAALKKFRDVLLI